MPISRAQRAHGRVIRRRRRAFLLAVAMLSCLAGLLSGGVLSSAQGLDATATCDPATSPAGEQPVSPDDPEKCPDPAPEPSAPQESAPSEPAPAEPDLEPAPEQDPGAPVPAPPADDTASGEPAPGGGPGPKDAPAGAPGGEVAVPAPAGEVRRSAPRRARDRRRATRRRSTAQRRRGHVERRRRAARKRATRRRDAERRRNFPRPGLRRPLPDPLPPAKRLDPGFARNLAAAARRENVSWSLVLAVLRARGSEGRVPASPAAVRALARELAALGAGEDPARAVLALARRSSFAEPLTVPGVTRDDVYLESVIALARFNRAVGLQGLVRGLDAVREKLADQVLASPRINLYPGGRVDVAAGRVDVRVLALMRYLALQHRDVTITSLISGHGTYTTSGSVSAHVFGRAVDIAALEGVSILGHQQPSGVTERALRNILALPAELRPRQLISLFELGGPSFAMGDHHDHIHAGY